MCRIYPAVEGKYCTGMEWWNLDENYENEVDYDVVVIRLRPCRAGEKWSPRSGAARKRLPGGLCGPEEGRLGVSENRITHVLIVTC